MSESAIRMQKTLCDFVKSLGGPDIWGVDPDLVCDKLAQFCQDHKSTFEAYKHLEDAAWELLEADLHSKQIRKLEVPLMQVSLIHQFSSEPEEISGATLGHDDGKWDAPQLPKGANE